MIRALNDYFFGEEHISWHDALWFYGCCSVIILIGIFVVIPSWFKLLTL